MRCLVTGGTGSLGRALVPYLLQTTDWRVIVFSRDEAKQAQMRAAIPDGRLDFFLGDVRDRDRLLLAFGPVDVVIHAAALKRVDSVARDPDEVVKTNVWGTRNVLLAAHATGVHRIVVISSDKACYATNAYGVSKALAEWMTVSYNVYGAPSGTLSSVLRYGNVLGSRGSVTTLWRGQQGPLTITDAQATRFVLTLEQAVRLVARVIADMRGGEIFVPRLPAVSILDLARAVRPDWDGRYDEIGVRPGGEKRHETLLTEEESARAVQVGSVMIVPPYFHPWTEVPAWRDEPKIGPGAYTSDGAPRCHPGQLRTMVKLAESAESAGGGTHDARGVR